MLSREIKDISQNHKAQAVVVGTYADSSSAVYVSAKIVSLANNSTMAAFDYVIPGNIDIRYLLRSGTRY